MHRVFLITLIAALASSCAPQCRYPLLTGLSPRDSEGVLSASANDERAEQFVRKALSAAKAGFLHASGRTFVFGKCNQGPIASGPFQSVDGNHIVVIVTDEAPSPVRLSRGRVSL